MRQYEAVIKVMEENGGYATLSYLYEHALKVPGVSWNTKTPFASIRRIVQDKRFFFKIRPGLWALKSYKKKLPKDILVLMEDAPGKKSLQLHAFYQGMLVEIGKLKGFRTYIPPQDRKRKFLQRPLADIVDVNKIFPFTYSEIIKKVQGIDVIWFNERKLPDSVFEVEYSTDFKGALLRFLELQDFNVKMYVVSHKYRQKELVSVFNYSAFKTIKERIKFLSFEDLSQWHARVYELSLVEGHILDHKQNPRRHG